MQGKFFNKDFENKIKPSFCSLGVTNKCMFKCRMCYKWQDATREESPTLTDYKNFISNLRELVEDDFKIHFGAGEVLLFDGVLDLVKFSVEKGFSTQIAKWLGDRRRDV